MENLLAPLVSRLLDVRTDEVLAQVLSSMVVEVHRQKSDICCHIRIAKPLVKFDAVKNGDLFTPEDMLQAKVSMTIPDALLFDPLVKNLLFPFIKLFRLPLHFPKNILWKGDIDILLCLFEVLVRICLLYTSPSPRDS